jgi:hypothetical protein
VIESNIKSDKHNVLGGLIASLAIAFACSATADIVDPPMQKFVDEGWVQFQDGGSNEDGTLGPGVGGQGFDAEYLFYKQEGSKVSIALQTGFDVVDGKYTYGGVDYYAGDLALSFDGDVTPTDETTYEYGIDFGLFTKNYQNENVNFTPGDNKDPAGLYKIATDGTGTVTGWDIGVVGGPGSGAGEGNAGHHESDPFAIDEIDVWGTGIDFDASTLDFSTSAMQGIGTESDNYYRIVSFDTAGVNFDLTQIDIHWTMSCGNDNINGSISVAEPESVAMILLGLFGLMVARFRKTTNYAKSFV